jgi:hypothetical protein
MRTLVYLHDCFIYCTSMHLHISIVAPHIGTLEETCEGCGVGAKPDDGVWWIHPEDGRTRKCLEERCSPSGFHLTNSNLSRIPGKPRSIISLLPSKQLILYMLYVLLH